MGTKMSKYACFCLNQFSDRSVTKVPMNVVDTCVFALSKSRNQTVPLLTSYSKLAHQNNQGVISVFPLCYFA